MIIKKVVCVTGCLGFMASYFTRKCLKLGWFVYGVDKCTYVANLSLLSEFESYDNFKFIKEDIKDLTFLPDCDYVVNFAAESDVTNSIINSDSFINSNILGTKNLLELIRHKPLNCTNPPVLVHISTDEVYGDIGEGFHSESDILKPSNPYSASKASADMLILAWSRTYSTNYIICRPTNNYGIGQYPEKLIPLSIRSLSRGYKVKLHNNGDPVRVWLHADDTAEAVLKIIDTNTVNEVYNISGGYEQSNLEAVTKIIYSYFGDDVNVLDYVDLSYNRAGQDVRYALDDSKLRTLGWSPKRVFIDEIDDIVRYYKETFIW